MVAETKLGVLLSFKCKYDDKISGFGGGRGWEIEKHLKWDYLNFSSSQLKSSIGRNATNSNES